MTEAARHVDFSIIRYAQCWEDADVLLDGLDIQRGDVCASIASAGDNALAMLTRDPARVVAIDLNPAQLACVALRVAAYRVLEHGELLELVGSKASDRRASLYARCRHELADDARAFWDARGDQIARGIGAAGKFERYFRLFRRRLLPLVHGRRTVDALLEPRGEAERHAFYRDRWDTWRWRLLFRVFFSRFVMGRAGRDPAMFKYVEGTVAQRILARTKHALTRLAPADNPYLQWILTERHTTALPLALRPEHFETIRDRLDRLEVRCASVEDYLDNSGGDAGGDAVDRWNLSDIFEYMSADAYHALVGRIASATRPGGRLFYWNMLASRSPDGRPADVAPRLRHLEDLSRDLLERDKAFFYSRVVVEEACA